MGRGGLAVGGATGAGTFDSGRTARCGDAGMGWTVTAAGATGAGRAGAATAVAVRSGNRAASLAATAGGAASVGAGAEAGDGIAVWPATFFVVVQ